MRELDQYSYGCGVIDCFCEIVGAGVKRLALSHPADSREERDEYLAFTRQICAKYQIQFYPEDDPLLTDLFPLSLNRGKYNLLFYREDAVLAEYLRLKEEKRALMLQGGYAGEARRQLAVRFGRLLSYSAEAIDRLIAQNTERE